MTDNNSSMDTRSLALSAIFSALSIMLTMAKITIPFPLLPYLEFDFSEIPVTISFFLLGPQYALLSAIIYWLVLTIRAGDLLGPAMKGVAVVSMIIGLWLTARPVGKNSGYRRLIFSGLIGSSILRVLAMSAFNYVVLTIIAPFWLEFASGLVATLGLPTTTPAQTILWVLLLTGLYNALHTVLSMIPSVYITDATINRMPTLQGNSWLEKYSKKK